MQKIKKQVSIKDIAREAGVSISTVSYVINNKKNVGKKTREKVLKIIYHLNYRTNTIARSLRTKTTKTIGVIVPDISTPFTSQVVRGMEEIARHRGYTIILGCNFYDLNEEKKQANVFLDQRVDGIIFFNGYDNYSLVKRIYDRKIPVVLIDREVPDEKIPSVTVDNIKGIGIAVDYLINLGHKKIGYITFSFENQTIVRKRFNGYCLGLEKNKIAYNPDYVINTDLFRLNEIDGTYECMKEYFKRSNIPTAFIAFTDYNAYGIIIAAKEMKIKVPKDLSVIGYDNIVFSHIIDPPLTTIKQPKKMMGKTGMNLLLDIVEGKRVKNKNIVLLPELLKRKSTSKPAGN